MSKTSRPSIVTAEVYEKFIQFCKKHGLKVGAHIERALLDYIENFGKR